MKTMNLFKSAIAPKIRRVIGSILFGSALLLTNCFAQGESQPAKTVPLEEFSGYYQFPSKAGFIQFEVKDKVLFAKQVWDGKEYPLIQLNGTNFESEKEGHKIEFLKDDAGQFTYAKLMGRIMTVKVGFDPKKVKPLSAAQLKRLEGTYFLQDDHNLKLYIQPSANGLTIKQLWDNKQVTFTPRSETFFLNDDGTFPLTFLLNDGQAVQVTCFADDIWLKAE